MISFLKIMLIDVREDTVIRFCLDFITCRNMVRNMVPCRPYRQRLLPKQCWEVVLGLCFSSPSVYYFRNCTLIGSNGGEEEFSNFG